MITISNLKKSFKDVVVLENINLEINDGDIYGLVGLSGAGKSTLLRCINGLERYDSGELLIDGKDVNQYIQNGEILQLRKSIGMIFQHFSLLERLTVYDNVALPMACWKYPKSETEQRVKELLELVGLADKQNAKPRQLSGGQKQRVAIARALTMQPKILLCDEATSALDPINTESILQLLKRINEQMGVTIVIVTHEMSVVKQVCNKIAALEKGHIRTTGLVEDIFLKENASLNNIVGNYVDAQLKENGQYYKLIFRDEAQGGQILSRLAIETRVPYTLVWSSFDRYREKIEGYYIIKVNSQEKEKFNRYLKQQPIEWEEVTANGAV